MRNRPLEGQAALVTGANSGIGEAVARCFAEAGAKVVINYVTHAETAEAIADEIKRQGNEAIALHADVSNEAEVKTMYAAMFKQYGTIDVLCANAGIQMDSPFVEMPLAKWNNVLAVNLTGQFLCAREAAREFLRRGVRPQISSAAGKIICMSSVHQDIPWAGHANYAASKGGIHMLMQTIAQELAPHKVRVNAIAPGAIQTPINRTAWGTPDALRKLLTLIPDQRIGQPADIGRAAVWLASDDSDYVQGTTLFVDGGMTLYPGFATGG
ncbi:MAG TPA: glucose 1-dehydrogenase [Candidatus Binataceae bacterium]|nr:glucose 1-dehydrogenase [Candidatus Binataceae bacterium]